jgi:Short C-terminal domain
MFGEKKLLREGMEARAVVLKADYRWDGMGGTHHIYRVELRIRFDDGSTAELHTKLDRNQVGEYGQADIIPVRYDATDHSKIVVDVPALEAEFQRSQVTREAEKASRIARSEAKLAGPAAERGGPTPATAQDTPASGGTAAAVEFLKSAMHEMSAAGAAQDSVEERLAKLQRLRDGGVLSTEEYAAQRQRILESL